MDLPSYTLMYILMAHACGLVFALIFGQPLSLQESVQVQLEMSSAKSQALSSPLKSSLEVAGAQVKLEAAGAGVMSPGASLPGCSVRSLLQDMGLQVTTIHIPSLQI